MADSAIITRRSALVGAFSLFIPPAALALIQPAIADQAPMTANERADFHFAEFCKAMDEVKPSDASGWRISGGRDRDEPVWSRRDAVYRVPQPDGPIPAEHFVFIEGDRTSPLCFLSKPRT